MIKAVRCAVVMGMSALWLSASAGQVLPGRLAGAVVVWSEPVALSDAQIEAPAPQVALSGDGTVHVVWQADEQVMHRRIQSAGPSTTVSAAYGYSPALAGGVGPAAHLAFLERTDGWTDVYYAAWDGESWSLPVNVSLTGSVLFSPSIAVDGATVRIAWADGALGDPMIFVAESTDGWSWTFSIVDGSWGAESVSLCVGPGAQPRVVWQAPDLLTDRYDVYYSQLGPAGWSLPESVSDTPDADSAAPRLVSVGGVNHVLWQESVGGRFEVWHVSGTVGAWSFPSAVSQGSDAALAPWADVVLAGGVIACWTRPTGVQVRERTAGVWAAVETVATSVTGVLDARVAAAASGAVHLVWAAATGEGEWQVMYSRRDGGAGTPTPTVTGTRTASPTATHTAARTATVTATQTATPTVTSTPRPQRRAWLPVVWHSAP